MNDRPNAVAVEPLSEYRLKVHFDNDESRIFDVKPYIKGSWYGQLGDPKTFDRVRVGWETVEWPDGQDICPDELYYDSIPV